ncbi:MAG: hypothetical protein HOV80_33135 [Polyangiaceae bacterium]|nr:hypothetical protein [Polyangiaceae bacterium]
MRHNLTVLAGALAGLLATVIPSTAHACWDGYSATVGNATFTRATGAASWNGDDARYTTRWAARFDAITPAGVNLWIGNGYVSCEGHKACETLGDVGSNDPQKAFKQVAKAFGVSAKAQQEALGVQQKLYTVQVFAGAKDAALKQKKLLAELDQEEALDVGDYGDFFLAGAFPGVNERFHAIADEKDEKLVRLIIDEYPSLEAAQEAEKKLRARGVIGIVKELPRGKALDEYVSSLRA